MNTLKARIEQLEARLGAGPSFDVERWKEEATAALASGDYLQFLEDQERQELERCTTEAERAEVKKWHAIARRQLAQVEALEEPPQ